MPSERPATDTMAASDHVESLFLTAGNSQKNIDITVVRLIFVFFDSQRSVTQDTHINCDDIGEAFQGMDTSSSKYLNFIFGWEF
ncbi:hypothetical protein chiPu_0016072 [Chiloscyllium punctatum]|uniref:Uncharacterized protein n=1 Tax=Chiloscyllium punctatum TaxID=137246 RepID=A0A401T4J7_CHIPU|nr:hypothetical protein [Chiloscyllium punctatum]